MPSTQKSDVAQAIAALHCQAARAESTDWAQIVRLYEVLKRVQPSPVVTLNRAVAVPSKLRSALIAMADSPQAAFGLMDGLAPELDSYHLFLLPVRTYSGVSEHSRKQPSATGEH